MIYYLTANFRQKTLVRISKDPAEIFQLKKNLEKEGVPVSIGSVLDVRELAQISCITKALGGII